MKNFRKVLALVLVVATLFSFAAMAGAKSLADYTDADKISTENYAVAVEVLSALEILNGYEDETFKPTNTISREEMAKMIAVLANAGDDVSALYAAANTFADVENARWSASYIAYCAQTGIVAGRTADTFDPYGKVTGLETAKMLLVTMGFSATEQGYVGANWKINVLRDAKNCGLLVGFATGYDIEAAITREEAALMMLNALQAKVVVGVLSENIVKVTNAVYANKLGATLIDAEKHGLVKLYGNVIVADKTLAEALYDARLTLVPTADCYDRPGYTWTLKNTKGTTVLTGKFVAAPVEASATVAMDLVDVLAEEFKLGNYKLNAYVDGIEKIDLETYNGTEDKALVKAFAAANTGNGVLTEVYVDDVADQITIVVVNTFIGTVTNTPAWSNTFTVDGYCFSNKGYDFETDDVILYWLCDSDKDNAGVELHAAKVAEPVSGLITRAEKANVATVESNFTHEGKVYNYHFGYELPLVGQDEVAASKNDGVSYDVYTDEYGYVMLWNETPVVADVKYGYFVEGTGLASNLVQKPDGSFDQTCTKDMVDFAAAYTKDVLVDEDLWDVTLDTFGRGRLLAYTVEADGNAYISGYATDAAINTVLKKNGNLVTVAADGTETIIANGNADSKYLVRTWNYETEEYVYTAYTEDTLPASYAGYVLRDANDDGILDHKMPTIQYFTKTVGTKHKTTVATYVFVDAVYAQTAQRAFILGATKSVSDSKFVNQIGAYDAYEAIVNGTAGYVLVNDTQALRSNVLVEATLECIGLNDNGLPVYAVAKNVKVDYIGIDFEFVGSEIIFNDKIAVAPGNSLDVAEGFFAVLVDAAGNEVIVTDPAELNDYVDEFEDILHAALCGCKDPTCAAYVTGDAWIVTNDADEVAELYIMLTYTGDLQEAE